MKKYLTLAVILLQASLATPARAQVIDAQNFLKKIQFLTQN